MKVRDGGRRWCSCGLPAGVRVEKVERADARGMLYFRNKVDAVVKVPRESQVSQA